MTGHVRLGDGRLGVVHVGGSMVVHHQMLKIRIIHRRHRLFIGIIAGAIPIAVGIHSVFHLIFISVVDDGHHLRPHPDVHRPFGRTVQSVAVQTVNVHRVLSHRAVLVSPRSVSMSNRHRFGIEFAFIPPRPRVHQPAHQHAHDTEPGG